MRQEVTRWAKRASAALLLTLTLLPIGRAWHNRQGLAVKSDDDEAAVVASTYFLEALRQGPLDPAWRDLDAIDHPPLWKYLHGLALEAAGRPLARREDKARYLYAKSSSTAEIAPEDLDPGRTLSAIAVAIAALLLGLIGAQIGGQVVGWTAALLFAWNSAVRWVAGRALIDGILALLILLGLWLQLRWVDRRAQPGASALGWAIAAGALAGCAFDTKITGAIVFIAGLFTLASQTAAAAPLAGGSTTFPSTVGFCLAFLVATVGLNPALLPNPVVAFQQMLSHRFQMVQVQLALEPEALFGPVASLSAAVNRVFLRPDPLFSTLRLPILACACVLGFDQLERRRREAGVSTWLIHAALWTCLTLFTYRLDWPRYLLPVLVFSAIPTAIGLAELALRPVQLLTVRSAVLVTATCLLVFGLTAMAQRQTATDRQAARVQILNGLLEGPLSDHQRALFLETQRRLVSPPGSGGPKR